MSQVNNTNKPFKLNDFFAVVIPFILIAATALYSPIITGVLLLAWMGLTVMKGVKVKNYKTGEEETFHDVASAAYEVKETTKDLIVILKNTSLRAADEFNHQQEMRALKLDVLGTNMKEQAEHRETKRAEVITTNLTEREKRQAANKAKQDAYRATYIKA